VKGVLRQAKFHGVPSTQNAIVRLVDKGIARCGHLFPKGKDVIVVYVPTTARHIRERGFDQAEWIAADVSVYVNAPIVSALRAASHKRQSHFGSDAARKKNVRGMLRVVTDVRGKRIILVDDVVTSGATMTEAARVLREAGAVSVFGIALARGGKKKPLA
jgi:ComF family protein